MNDAKTVVRVVLLFTALLCTTGIAGDDVPDLSQLGSRSELDTLIASSGDAALKKALVDHADDILAAAKRHPHVKAVIRTIESAPGSLQFQSDCQVRYFGWCGVHVSIRNFLIVDLTRVTTQAALDLPSEGPAIEQPGVHRNGQAPPHKSAILWQVGDRSHHVMCWAVRNQA